MARKWTAADMPDQAGRVAVVTGANSGIGLYTARELARRHAKTVLACRNTVKGQQAVDTIRAAVPDADLELEGLDLANLASVRDFAARFSDRHESLDLLINNAGVMAPPRQLTADGFESQFGTNHLGHFALTGLLLPKLLAAPVPRVVTVSSPGHRIGQLNFDDLQREHRYINWLAYGQSKLANLMFCFELDRRARAAEATLASMASHPGYAATNLQFAGPSHWWEQLGGWLGNMTVAQSAEMGALPSLFAATEPELRSGSFVGPDGFLEQRGHPHVVTAASKAYDEDTWRHLWQVSEELTGVSYSL